MIVKRGWRPLVALQAAGLGLTIAAAVVGGVIGAIAEVAARAAIVDDTGIIIGSTISTMIAAVLSGIAAVLIAPLTLTAYADMRVNVEPVTSASIAQELGIAVPGAPPYPYGGYAYR